MSNAYRNIPRHPCLVLGYLLGVQQFTGGRVFAQVVRTHGTRIHERLRNNRQTRVHNVRLVDVKHVIRVLYDSHPEPEW